jgi:PKD repeat protein
VEKETVMVRYFTLITVVVLFMLFEGNLLAQEKEKGAPEQSQLDEDLWLDENGNPIPAPPDAVPKQVKESTSAHFALLSHSVDVKPSAALVLIGIEPNSNKLLYSGGSSFSIDVVSGPSNGLLEMNNPSKGYFIYMPNAGFIGDDSFVWRAFDGASYSEEATVVLHVRYWGDREEIGARIVDIAVAEHGGGFYDLGKNLNYYPYALSDHMSKQAWCSEFVSWAYKAGGDPLTGGYRGGWLLMAHTTVSSWFRNNRVLITRSDPEWDTYEPRPGDYLWWSGQHSGMVWGVEGNTLYSLEGNIGDRVVARRFSNWRSSASFTGVGVRVPMLLDTGRPVANAGPDMTVYDTNCDGMETVILDGSASYDEDGNIQTFAWTENCNSVGEGESPTVELCTGMHYVVLTVTDDKGSQDSDTVRVIVNSPLLTASFAASPISGTAPFTVSFTDTSTGDVTGWHWSFGDGATSTAQDTSHVYRDAGTYTVTLTVTGPDGSATQMKNAYITVNEAGSLTANFTANPVSGVAPLMVHFTDTSAGDVTDWSWDFGDGGTSDEQNPSHGYASVGTYTVTLVVSGSGSDDDTMIKTDYITVTHVGLVVAGKDKKKGGCSISSAPLPAGDIIGYFLPLMLLACTYLALHRRRET